MEVTIVNSMGDDLTIVNAARVSFDKQTSWERQIDTQGIYELADRDKKLINFLAKHGHWSPFGHAQLSFRIKAPIFVARQLVKHQVSLCWNEVSRRYVDSPPEFYYPEKWRGNAENKKQGSDQDSDILWIDRETRTGAAVSKAVELCADTYQRLLDAGVCAEQARMLLPQNMYTEWFWSGSLYAFSRVCNLRCKGDTQAETREVAWEIHDLAKEKFPVSWPALFYHALGN